MKPGILTITTDFGMGGPYVAALKGVLLGLAPGTQFVDVCHTISPQNILEGGFILAGIVDVFPKGTVHLAVVDPGVGTERRLIAVSVADQWFVLPDNGLITGVAHGRTPAGTWEITNPRFGARSSRPLFTDATFSPRLPLIWSQGVIRRAWPPSREIHHPPEFRAERRRPRVCWRGNLSRRLWQPDHEHQCRPPGGRSPLRLGDRDRRRANRGDLANLR